MNQTDHTSSRDDSPAAPPEGRRPEAGDGALNGEHNGAGAAENSGPGTPGNAEGARDGTDGGSRQAEERAEQSTLSGPPGAGSSNA